eukprot:IDg8176t1
MWPVRFQLKHLRRSGCLFFSIFRLIRENVDFGLTKYYPCPVNKMVALGTNARIKLTKQLLESPFFRFCSAERVAGSVNHDDDVAQVLALVCLGSAKRRQLVLYQILPITELNSALVDWMAWFSQPGSEYTPEHAPSTILESSQITCRKRPCTLLLFYDDFSRPSGALSNAEDGRRQQKTGLKARRGLSSQQMRLSIWPLGALLRSYKAELGRLRSSSHRFCELRHLFRRGDRVSSRKEVVRLLSRSESRK